VHLKVRARPGPLPPPAGRGAVVADVAKLSAGRERYYLDEVAHTLEDYYNGKGESPGRWVGPTAERLGLQAEVTNKAFQLAFDGRHPVTGELLGRAHPRNGMRGYDVVFRPVKDVSLLYGLGSLEVASAALAAHRAGVDAAIAYLDETVGARRGKAGRDLEHVAGQGVLAASFTHRQSREQDPLLHDHVIVFNRIQGPDGRWTAIDGRDIYQNRLAMDAVYRTTYQAQLTRELGVRWSDPDQHGNRSIVGMPEELVQAMSKRDHQIRLALEAQRAAHRTITPELRRVVVSETRKAKEHIDEMTLRDRWTEEAAALGFTREEIERAVLGRTKLREPTRAQLEALFDEVASPEGLTEKASTFIRADVVQAIGDRIVGVDGERLRELADEFLASHSISVAMSLDRNQRRYSTAEMLQQEELLLGAGERRQHEGAAVVHGEALRAALQAHPTIGQDQAAFVRDLTQSGAGVVVGVGPAGTGKTFAIGAARMAWEYDGYRVIGAAPTGVAAIRLEQGSAIDGCRTIDRLLSQLERGKEKLDERTVLVVDEAGMVGTRRLVELAAKCEQAKSKLVLVGDEKQLAAIDAGGGFRALRLRLGATELTENRRQSSEWGRKVTALLREGRASEAFVVLRTEGRVTVARTAQEANDALVAAWWPRYSAGIDAGMIAQTRAEVEYLNVVARQLMRDAGRLGRDEFQHGSQSFAIGDAVILGRNARHLSVANGTRGTVEGFDPATGSITVKTTDGKIVTLPRSYLDDHGRLGKRPAAPALTWGYAVTGHREQGDTMKETYLRVCKTATSAWSYVGASRFKDDLRVFMAQGELVDDPELDVTNLMGPQPWRETVEATADAIEYKSGQQEVATDQRHEVNVHTLPTELLRRRRDELADILERVPERRSHELKIASRRREQAERDLADAEMNVLLARGAVVGFGERPRFAQRQEHRKALEAVRQAERRERHARSLADRASVAEAEVRQHEHRRAAFVEMHEPDRYEAERVAKELAWRRLATARAVEVLRPPYLTEMLGACPSSGRARRKWHRAVELIEEYRETYGITDPEQALGDEQGGFVQRQEWREARATAARVQEREQTREQELAWERTRERVR
jgi:conjugative relaxase-like TrwC/TraI family protein